MLGIYCLVSTSNNNFTANSIKPSPHASRSDVHHSDNGHVKAFLHAPGYRIRRSTFKDPSGSWLLIDGIALDPHTYRELDAEQLLLAVKNHGCEYLHHLNGEFLILVSLGANVWLVTDRMAQRQHCIARTQSHIAIAPTPGHAVDLAGIQRKVHHDALLTFLLTNKIRLGEQTIWDACETIPNATQYHIDPLGKFRQSQYWHVKYSPDYMLKREDLSEQAAEIFAAAVSARIPDDRKICMPLTGGLDSRLMAGAVPPSKRKSITCATMGSPNCDEILLAMRVAATAGYQHFSVHIAPTTPFHPDYESFLADDDIDLIIQNCWQPFTEANATNDFILHGLDLDVTLGGIYLTPELEKIRSHDLLLEYALANSLSAPYDVLRNLFRQNILPDPKEALCSRISGMLDSVRQEHVLNTYDHFILKYSMHRVILQRYRSIRSKIDTFTPMYDSHLIDLYLKTPPEYRAQHRLFQQVLMRTCPELAAIPYQRTSLPANAPLHLWPEGQRLEQAREQLYRAVARESAGNCYIPYTRHYTNVDEWLRFNKTWQKAVAHLLLSPDSLIVENYVNPTQLTKILNEHQTHERAHMKLIHVLLSAEIFLRRVNGATTPDLLNHWSQHEMTYNHS